MYTFNHARSQITHIVQIKYYALTSIIAAKCIYPSCPCEGKARTDQTTARTLTPGNINQLQNINIHTFVQRVYACAETLFCNIV